MTEEQTSPDRTRGEEEVGRSGPRGSAAAWALAGASFSLAPFAAAFAFNQPGAVVAAGAAFLLFLVAGVALMLHARSVTRTAPAARPLSVDGEAPGSEEAPRPIDGLTGLPTFQPFSERLLAEFHHVKESGGRMALVLVDIENLTRINEQFGARAGADALEHVGSCIQAIMRGNDLVARMGDDEFGVILPECDLTGADAFVSRLHDRLGGEPLIVSADGGPVTLRIGVCAAATVCGPDASDPDEIITAAVQKLDEARYVKAQRKERLGRAA